MVAFYQVDLVFGTPIKQFGDDEGTYASDRLIRFAHGDTKRALTRHSGNLSTSNESYADCIESREIAVKNDTATTTVTIRDGCNVPLSLVSYRKPGPGWSPETEPDQSFVDADSATLGPGTHTFSVALPDAYDTTGDRTVVAGDSATFGENVTLGPGVVVGDDATVASETSVSHRTLLGRNVTVGSGVTIGAGVIVSHDVSIGDGTQVGSGTRVGSDVSIGQNVLIGQNVKIRPGVSIDDGATIPPNTTVDSDVSGTDEGVVPSEPTAPPSSSPAMPAVPGSGSQSPTTPQTESPAEPEPTATATAEPAPTATDTTSPDTSTTTQPSESTTQPPSSSTRTGTSVPTESPPSTSTETVPTTASTTSPSGTVTESPTTDTATTTATSSPTAEQPTEPGTATETATQSPETPTTAPSPTSTAPTTAPTTTASPTTTATATPPTDTTATSTPPATTSPSPTTAPTETATSTTTATTPTTTSTTTTPTETATQTATTTPPTTTSTATTTQTTTTTPPTETTTPEPPGSPNIALSPATSDYGETLVGTSGTQTFTVTNDGDEDLSVDGVSLTGSNADQYEITDGGGSFVLAPGDSRLVTVKFSPTVTGQQTATLDVTSDDPDSPTVSSTLSGTGVQPAIGLTPTEHEYGSVPVDSGDTKAFTVTNDGTAPLSVSGTTITGANAEEFALVDGGRSYMLAPGESRDIRVRFVPTSTGAKSATLELASDDPDRPTVTAALTGTGTASNIAVDPPSYDYRQVPNGGSQTKSFTVTNDGDAPLSVSSTSIVGPNAGDFAIVDGGGTFTLQPGESQSVEVRIDFAPTTTGEKNAQLVVESDAANQPTVTVPLSGESIAPSISLTPETRDLGEVPVGSVNTATFTVTNDGTATLDVSAVNVVGADASEFTVIGPDSPFSVEPGQSREITVEFAPDSAGAKSASIEVQSNDPEQSTVTAALTGTGTASNLVADPTRHDFGEVATGTTGTTTITVTNDGTAPLAVTDTSIVGANGEQFTVVDGGGPFTLDAGESQEVTFTIDTSTFKAGEITYSVTVDASTRTGRITVE